jgi:hypothetical protein
LKPSSNRKTSGGSFFVRVVSEADAIQKLPTLLREAEKQAVVVRDGERELGAIMSMKDYETIRKAKVERLKMAMKQFGEALRADPDEAGISLDELERTHPFVRSGYHLPALPKMGDRPRYGTSSFC